MYCTADPHSSERTRRGWYRSAVGSLVGRAFCRRFFLASFRCRSFFQFLVRFPLSLVLVTPLFGIARIRG
ncbi:hypothetical protein NDI85_03015 [Halomicroarcula sp. S1AR25-4]|uniref:hypothetical protein n=1 Tax=Haloarcula sp. S1AR25-4 TaxID=2950538 RepID=UPI002876C201|nr:hypothetical protein [Halomicroarcula sp. S1AR25-4]MDS0276749.1 hypothetical protein [Halomicroarcula sp. S1AR25-4]